MPMGPIELADIVGLDVVPARRQDPSRRPSGDPVPRRASHRLSRPKQARPQERRRLLRVAGRQGREAAGRRASAAGRSQRPPDAAAAQRGVAVLARTHRRRCRSRRRRRDLRRGLRAVSRRPAAATRATRGVDARPRAPRRARSRAMASASHPMRAGSRYGAVKRVIRSAAVVRTYAVRRMRRTRTTDDDKPQPIDSKTAARFLAARRPEEREPARARAQNRDARAAGRAATVQGRRHRQAHLSTSSAAWSSCSREGQIVGTIRGGTPDARNPLAPGLPAALQRARRHRRHRATCRHRQRPARRACSPGTRPAPTK